MRNLALCVVAWMLAAHAFAVDYPDQATSAFARAQVAIAEHDCEAAIRFLTEAIGAAPGYWEAHRSMGECLLKLNRPGEARKHLEESLRLNASDSVTQGMLRRAIELEKAHAEDDALAARLRQQIVVRPSQPAIKQPRPLGDSARNRPSPGAKAASYVLTGSPDDARSAASIEAERAAPKTLLDSMRDRANSIFRPRMAAVAPAVKAFLVADRRYRDSCRGKTTTSRNEGEVTGSTLTSGSILDRTGQYEIGRFNGESSWSGRWQGYSTLKNEDTAACRTIASDMSSLAARVASAMDGVDTELASPPSVYPGIREEVFAKLAQELW
jgi:tetratricopeptide repeat protein